MAQYTKSCAVCNAPSEAQTVSCWRCGEGSWKPTQNGPVDRPSKQKKKKKKKQQQWPKMEEVSAEIKTDPPPDTQPAPDLGETD